MYKFPFFCKKKSATSDIKDNAFNDVDNIDDISTCENESSLKEIVRGFYHTKSSISNVLVNIEFLYKNLFSGFVNVEKVCVSLISKVNDGRIKVNAIFEDIEKHNKEKLQKVTDIIMDVQKSLETINSFLGATNMISLNAKLEAARAKEYGKGFSVVADEIKRLSDQAKGVMNMISVKEIEQVSTDLISENIKELQLGIDNLFLNMIEELTSLEESFKYCIGQQGEFSTLINELENIEASVSYLSRNCDSFSVSKAFVYSNDDFLKELEFIISEHMSWMSVVKAIVDNQKSMAIQSDPMKHGFGLFYQGFAPKELEIREVWENIYSDYLNIHKLVVEIIKIFSQGNFNNADLKNARDFFMRAENLSNEIISRLESVKNMVVECENQSINVFC
ncbi:Methyl-accepting chemotaxis protein [Borrelia crocidurae DOU]|uniref:Methyl-accepting chemotaxis protein n=1 Tax=Borrelia crocidurae DOU TaxID=1293575 RepID=W5SI87_9SPIR|nr:methyl-accepting chemotaxis protein [Borrelia crocidurae]AHH06642.1 Methyl-accepting chemotaxis protein [Borrelia crocidurae DOU]